MLIRGKRKEKKGDWYNLHFNSIRFFVSFPVNYLHDLELAVQGLVEFLMELIPHPFLYGPFPTGGVFYWVVWTVISLFSSFSFVSLFPFVRADDLGV